MSFALKEHTLELLTVYVLRVTKACCQSSFLVYLPCVIEPFLVDFDSLLSSDQHSFAPELIEQRD